MNPSAPQQPSFMDNLLNFFMGRGTLSNLASGNSGQSSFGQPSPGLQQGNSQIFSDPSQNNTQMQQIVNQYMAQKAAADAAKSGKKKKQPVMTP